MTLVLGALEGVPGEKRVQSRDEGFSVVGRGAEDSGGILGAGGRRDSSGDLGMTTGGAGLEAAERLGAGFEG